METPEIKLYELLQRLNLNQQDAETFVASIKDLNTEHLATKVDVANLEKKLSGEIADVRTELAQTEKRIVNNLTIRIVIAFVAYALAEYVSGLF